MMAMIEKPCARTLQQATQHTSRTFSAITPYALYSSWMNFLPLNESLVTRLNVAMALKMRQTQLSRHKAAWKWLAYMVSICCPFGRMLHRDSVMCRQGCPVAVQLESVVTFGLKSDTGRTLDTLSATGGFSLLGLYTEVMIFLRSAKCLLISTMRRQAKTGLLLLTSRPCIGGSCSLQCCVWCLSR